MDLDADLASELGKYIELLTMSGHTQLNSETLKAVKNICRKSDVYVTHAYHVLMHQLDKDHSEIRLSTVIVCDELFRRSHVFRGLLLNDFQPFLECTVETDPEEPLPPPKTAAKTLKSKTLQLIQSWYDKYGEAYKQLKLGYMFLKKCKNVDFSDIQARTVAERQRHEQAEEKRQILLKENARKALTALEEKRSAIDSCILEVNTALELMLASVEDVFTSEDFTNLHPSEDDTSKSDNQTSTFTLTNATKNPAEAEDSETDFVREHGLGSRNYSLTINVNHLPKGICITPDNRAIVETLEENIRTICNSYLPVAEKCVQSLTKAGGQDYQLKSSIDLKQSLQKIIDRYKSLNIERVSEQRTKLQEGSEDEDDDEFEDVPEKEGYEDAARAPPVKIQDKTANVACTSLQSSQRKWIDETSDPTTAASTLAVLARKIQNDGLNIDLEQPSTSRAEDVRDKTVTDKNKLAAPKIRFDTDLLRWDEKLEAPTVVKPQGLHRFWLPAESEPEVSKPEDAALLRMRKIEFTGEFKPVKWQCRYPLPSGKLCPRYDRVKCPLHGVVIARDELGNPTNTADIERLKKEKEADEKNKPPDWQDPQLLKEIEAETGIDLTIGKKKKRKRFPNLTDVKAENDTSRNRLESKIFNKTALKRVASTLDSIDYKRHRDKFGDQYNYTYET